MRIKARSSESLSTKRSFQALGLSEDVGATRKKQGSYRQEREGVARDLSKSSKAKEKSLINSKYAGKRGV